MMLDVDNRITINSPRFAEMIDELDCALKNCVGEMLRRQLEDGRVGLTIGIKINNTYIRDESADGGSRMACIPNIDYRLSMSLQQKASQKGKIVDSWDKEIIMGNDGYYVVNSSEVGGQLSALELIEGGAKHG